MIYGIKNFISLGLLKILPTSIIKYAVLSFLTVFLTTLSSVGFAFFLQGFLALIGLVDKKEVSIILQPLLSNEIIYIFLFTIAIILQGLSGFIQTLVNLRFANTFIFEMRKIIFEKIYIKNENSDFSLSKTYNILIEVIPQSAQYFTGCVRFITLFLESLVVGIICIYLMPFEFIISFLCLSVIFPISSFFNATSKKLANKLVLLGEELNKQLMVSVKNYLFLNTLGLLEKEKNKTIKSASNFLDMFNKMSIPHSLGATIAVPISLTVVIILFYIFSKTGSNIINMISFFYSFQLTTGNTIHLVMYSQRSYGSTI